jgi:hypothetical protein
MAPQPQFLPDPASVTSGQARWGLPLRVAFRFLLLYFGLFSLLGQILGGLLPILKLDIPNLAEPPPFRGIVLWTAAHVFRTAAPLIYTDFSLTRI